MAPLRLLGSGLGTIRRGSEAALLRPCRFDVRCSGIAIGAGAEEVAAEVVPLLLATARQIELDLAGAQRT